MRVNSVYVQYKYSNRICTFYRSVPHFTSIYSTGRYNYRYRETAIQFCTNSRFLFRQLCGYSTSTINYKYSILVSLSLSSLLKIIVKNRKIKTGCFEINKYYF